MDPVLDPAWTRHLPSGIAPDAVDLLRNHSLPAAWARHWARDPNRPTIHHDGRWVGAGELDGRSRLVAGRFARAGLVSGDRVVFSAATSAELVIAHVAALRMGLVVVPVNCAYREREMAQIVRDCEPVAAVVDDGVRGQWITQASGGGAVVVSPEIELPDGSPSALDAVSPADPALLCYTSGTTGAPKGALITHGNALASGEAVRLAWRWDADDRLVLALPLFHMHGLGVGLHGTLLSGASAVLQPRFDTDAVLDACRDQRATLFFGVPTMYARLASSSRVTRLSALRLCVSGSAPLAADLHGRMARTGIRVLERYGMTETLMNVSNPYDGERRAGTVGFPLPGVEVRLDENGSDADAEGGEILLRGPNVFPGYWRRADATRDAFVDGWFRSGDIGSFDDDGYLRIVGRSKDLIISGGFNVYPREVEDVLLEHPAVAEVAVVGVPSDEWGEIVTAVVVANGPVDEQSLLAHAALSLAPSKRPRTVRFVRELPRNALGKILRDEVLPREG